MTTFVIQLCYYIVRKTDNPFFLPTGDGLFPRYRAAIFYPYIIIFLSQILLPAVLP